MLDGSYSTVSDIYYGYWENINDSLSISINFVYGADSDQTMKYFARNLNVSDLTFIDGEMQASLALDVYVAAEYTRSHELVCDGTVKYADDDAFINSLLLSPSGEKDWYEYDGEAYAKEDWATKTIAYQFTGVMQLEGGDQSGAGINYPTVMNLYTDGSVRILHATVMAGSTVASTTDTYYGLWENNEGSLSISINFVYGAGTNGMQYFERNLNASELAFENGEIQATLDLDVYVAAGYTRSHELVCDGTVKYATDEAFEESFANLK